MGDWRKLGLLAGGGELPRRILAERAALGEEICLIRITGSADAALSRTAGADCGVGEAGKIVRLLNESGCDAVCFAGYVRRPDFSALKVDGKGAMLLPRIIASARHGDGAILKALVGVFEAEGFRVIGADNVVEGLSAPEGALGASHPGTDDMEDIAKASSLINALGPYDVGQGAIVANGYVLAVEAAEGTDAMIARCAELPGRAKGERSGVLVKQPKPDQDARVDLPVIGPETVRGAAAAGLAGIAIEAGAALVINREELVKAADGAGLFVYGFRREELKGR